MSEMTTTPPTRDGWYWLLMPGEMYAMPCCITEFPAGLFCATWTPIDGDALPISDEFFNGAMWSLDPITPPGDING